MEKISGRRSKQNFDCLRVVCGENWTFLARKNLFISVRVFWFSVVVRQSTSVCELVVGRIRLKRGAIRYEVGGWRFGMGIICSSRMTKIVIRKTS